MVRFTIRDGLFVLAIIGVSLAWWLDHHQLANKNERLRAENFDLRTEKLDLSIRSALAQSIPKGEKRVRELFDLAQKSSLSPEQSEEVLSFVQHNPDYRVRVRAMAILPYLREREKSIDVLIDVLRKRNRDESADGLLPQYAAKYLAHMKAEGAIEDVQAWLEFLKTESPYDEEARGILIESAENALAQLVAGSEPSP